MPTRIRQIESLHVAIRNASAHETHDQFTGLKLIHWFSLRVSCGSALKSCRMLLDRRRRLVNELQVHHPAVVHYYVFCVFPSIICNKCSLPALCHNYFFLPPLHTLPYPTLPSLICNKCSLPALCHNYFFLPPLPYPTLPSPPLPSPPLPSSSSEGTYQSPIQQHCIRFFFLYMGDYFHSQLITRQFYSTSSSRCNATQVNSALFTCCGKDK